MIEPTIGDILAAALAEPQPLIVRAAGEVEALRELANNAYLEIGKCAEFDPLAYTQAITLASLAAAKGEHQDRHAFVYLMANFADFWRGRGSDGLATYWHGQALFVAESFAKDGDEAMADMVAAAADELPREVHLEAQRLAEVGRA